MSKSSANSLSTTMRIINIEANLGQLFKIASPAGTWVGKVLRREPTDHRSKGWEVEDTRDKRVQLVSTHEILELHQPYIPGEEDDQWEYKQPITDNRTPDLTPNLSITPTPDTPCFDLLTPNAFRVWFALYDHAQLYRLSDHKLDLIESDEEKDEPDDVRLNMDEDEMAQATALKDVERKELIELYKMETSGRGIPGSRPQDELKAPWSYDQIATVCGCERGAIYYALRDLEIAGWITKGRLKGPDGTVIGFWYRINQPPAVITDVAYNHFKEEAKKSLAKSKRKVNSLRKWRKRKDQYPNSK